MQVTQHHACAHAVKVPFQLSVSVDEVVLHPGWVKAWHTALTALSTPGLIVVLGQAGTGKTLFLRGLTHALEQAGWDALLLQHGSTPEVADPQVVLIDDADRLPGTVLDALARQQRPCILAGLPSLLQRLSEPPDGSRVARLAPLAQADVLPFLTVQLARSGQPAGLLHPEAVAALARHSAGVPRALQAMANLAVFLARLEDAPRVTAEHVAEAAEVQDGTTLRHEDMLDQPVQPNAQEQPGEPPATPPRLAPAASGRWSQGGWRTRAAVVVGGALVLGALAATRLIPPGFAFPGLSAPAADARPTARPPEPSNEPDATDRQTGSLSRQSNQP